MEVDTRMRGSDAAALLPHSGRMALLARVVDYDGDSITCSVEIGPDSQFVSDGRVGPWVGLEYMAQTVAAHGGRVAVERGEPIRIGFLLACRSIDFRSGPFHVGQTLHVSARHIWGDEHLMKFACSVVDAATGAELQEAELSVYNPGDEEIEAGKAERRMER